MKLARRQLEELWFDGMLYLRPIRTYWERREIVKERRKPPKSKRGESTL